MFLREFSTYFHTENTVRNTARNITKLDQIEKLELSKKAAVVSNFCLIGKIPHNFLVPKMIEWTCKTFMPIQTLNLHRVLCSNVVVICEISQENGHTSAGLSTTTLCTSRLFDGFLKPIFH